jgi:putative membrane protein
MSEDGAQKEGKKDEKTDLAEDRTLLANERTFAGWMRTGLASIGVGVGFGALFQAIEPSWVPRALATSFVVLGAAIVFAAQRRACEVLSKMDAHYVRTTRSLNLRLIGWATALASTGLVAAIWMAPIK